MDYLPRDLAGKCGHRQESAGAMPGSPGMSREGMEVWAQARRYVELRGANFLLMIFRYLPSSSTSVPWPYNAAMDKRKGGIGLRRESAILAIARLAVLCFLLAAKSASADIPPVQVSVGAQSIDLSTSTWVLEDPDGKLTLTDVMDTGNASRFRLGSPNIGMSTSTFWLRFTVTNTSQRPVLWWLDSGNRTLQEIDLYWQDENGTYQRTATGSKHRFAERPLSASTFVFPLVVQGGRQVDIYLRVRSTGFLGVALIPKLWQPDAFRLESRTALVLWFFALGIGAALALINLMLAFYNRDINKLFYVLSLASGAWGLSSAAGGYGAAYEYFWPESPVFEQTAWVAAISAVTIFPTLFMSYLLEFHRDRPQLTRVIYATAGFNVIATCFQVVVTAMQLPNAGAILQKAWAIGSLSYSLMDSALIYGVLTAAFSGNRSAKFIAVAFVPFLLLQTRAAYQTVYSTLEWLPLILSVVYEWCVMALAVADRYYQTGLERSQAKAALVEGLKQSERELEGKEMQRTEELQREQIRTRELLHNILPVEVAEELSTKGKVQSARHDSVSILFTDFRGFTQAASTMPADRMVAELKPACPGCG